MTDILLILVNQYKAQNTISMGFRPYNQPHCCDETACDAARTDQVDLTKIHFN